MTARRANEGGCAGPDAKAEHGRLARLSPPPPPVAPFAPPRRAGTGAVSGMGGAEPKTVQRIETLRYWGGLPVYRPSNGDADWFALVTFSDVLSAHYTLEKRFLVPEARCVCKLGCPGD